jgi:DNA replication protein DnaC
MIDKNLFLTSDPADALLIEEQSEGDIVEIECDCNNGFIIVNNIAKQCDKCKNKRIVAIRRAKLNNIPKHLRRFPIKFDIPVTLTILNQDLKPAKTIKDVVKIEEKFNNSIFKMLNDGANFYIFGNSGSGKTMTACGIAVKYIEDGKTAVFAISPELFDMAFSASSMNSNQKQIFYSDLLVIDDFGTEFIDSKNFKTSFMSKIVATRITRKKPTIITSSMTRPDSLDGIYGKSLSQLIRSNFLFLNLASKESYSQNMTSSSIEEFIGDME